ncbi:MAG: TadE family protein [Mobilitalea sp.]
MSANLTVEAAYILPIVIFTIFALIYLAFYLHDRSRIQGMVDKTLHKAGFTVKHEADIATGEISYDRINDRGVFYLAVGSTEMEEKQIQKYLQQELADKLFLSKIKSVKVEVGKFKITITVETNTKVSLPGIKYLFDQFSYTEIEGEYPVHNPTETIRRAEVALETGSKIKGIDELKEKMERIFN